MKPYFALLTYIVQEERKKMFVKLDQLIVFYIVYMNLAYINQTMKQIYLWLVSITTYIWTAMFEYPTVNKDACLY